MVEFLSASGTAREVSERFGINVSPRIITDLFYLRVLSDEACPIVGGRRLIPRTYLPVIVDTLRSRGLLVTVKPEVRR